MLGTKHFLKVFIKCQEDYDYCFMILFLKTLYVGGGGGGKDNVHSALVEVNKNFGITSESLFLQVLR